MLREFLRWQLKYGRKQIDDVVVETIDPIVIAAAERTLAERPLLTRDLEQVLLWFYQLSVCRPQAFSAIPCSIPLVEIESFYRIYRIGEFLTPAEFCDYMVSLDREMIEWHTERERAHQQR